MARTQAHTDDDEPTTNTNRTAPVNDEHESTYDEHEHTHDAPHEDPVEEEEKTPETDEDRSASHRETHERDSDDGVSTHSVSTVSTTNPLTIAKKKAKLEKYMRAEKRRNLRMKIKETVYKIISENMNISTSEPDSSDNDLMDSELGPHRIATLKRKYKRRRTRKITMK